MQLEKKYNCSVISKWHLKTVIFFSALFKSVWYPGSEEPCNLKFVLRYQTFLLSFSTFSPYLFCYFHYATTLSKCLFFIDNISQWFSKYWLFVGCNDQRSSYIVFLVQMNTQEKPGLHIVQIHYSPKTLCTIFCLKKKKVRTKGQWKRRKEGWVQLHEHAKWVLRIALDN